MQLGDRYIFTPYAFCEGQDDSTPGKRTRTKETVTGRIVYIHPKGRFFTVEAVVHGHALRESFDLDQRPERGARQ